MSVILDGMRRYAHGNPLRLHTPGHKGKADKLDITELTDGSFPDSQIKKACEYIASIYGAKRAYILCGGSSQGVKAEIFAAAANGIVDVNSHRSVFDGFRLAGKKAVAVGKPDDIHPITVGDIEIALTPDIGAVVVTSPTYYGFCADIDGIAEFCKAHGLTFIIDGAHGAHFGFGKKLPGFFAGKCDMCNVSVHKTLGALTQTALLFDNTDSPMLEEAVAIMGTTSPSYPLMASAENAVIDAKRSEKAYDTLYGLLDGIRRNYPFIKNDDFTRMVLDCAALNMTGGQVNDAMILRNVYAEKITDRYAVFLFTAADGRKETARFESALREITERT